MSSNTGFAYQPTTNQNNASKKDAFGGLVNF